MQSKKKSVTKTIASSLLLILLLSVATTGFAIFTLSSSLSDAEAVNVAGSMRMQSYRLAYDVKSDFPELSHHIELFESSILSPSMQSLSAWYVPKDITQDYDALIKRWQSLKGVLQSEQKSQYLDLVAGFVQQVDGFVFKLQRFSEQKLIKLAWVGGMGLGGILLISVFVVRFTRKEIVRPLHALVGASEQIQSRSFDVELNVGKQNELGILTRTFNHMAHDLGKLYKGLEQAVNEKTHRLQVANQSLEVLYRSSQELTASVITAENFQAILKQLVSLEGVEAARLEIDNPGEKSLLLYQGDDAAKDDFLSQCHVIPLTLDDQPLGSLYWRAGLPCADLGLIDNFVHILSRAIYYNHAQQQASQLLLMEERATIARELHDSLAQSLSYLKIQMSLLKRQISEIEPSVGVLKTQQVISELDTGLSSAYTQLRELLTTFRLTIKEGSFGAALSEMLKQLEEQSAVVIRLENELSSIELDAHQQVHLLQLIREATINAIKHAQASNIDVRCYEQAGEVTIRVKDDGIGFDDPQTKQDHYGMSIMQERASRLNGVLTVHSSPNQGCEIVLTYPRVKE
ncbi:two-component system, NarL family, nitrate/nitrite sensor histidine kinase NarQ [Vibrio xiamenensis]|uniref:Sensor protein n=1 Tax=Vibrio xiamenensis TaxID=861298 RepID=A0A1G7YVN0_9VIBR|nr:nitrate/nitrite two-component system sensor histidine kinase NarQ [Vibrio xiamenensis]SDH00405.1 two-component system, NarL family, nitrate/nitrite sensor histidine kinase NarQ [Vibrio xiamenensis]